MSISTSLWSPASDEQPSSEKGPLANISSPKIEWIVSCWNISCCLSVNIDVVIDGEGIEETCDGFSCIKIAGKWVVYTTRFSSKKK